MEHRERIDLDRLTTEARNPRSTELDRLDTLDMVRLINAEDAAVADAVGRVAPDIARYLMAMDRKMEILAEYLVGKGVPFRQGHHLVGQAVRAALAKGCGLCDLSVAEYQAISPYFGDDVHDGLDAVGLCQEAIDLDVITILGICEIGADDHDGKVRCLADFASQ